MRENTPDLEVEIRRTARKRRHADDSEYETVEVAVAVANPQSHTRDTRVDDGALVGEIPVTNADTPCSDDRLDAAAITAREERVTTYYPHGDRLIAFAWDAATDQWECEERALDADEFDIDEGRFEDEETVVWARDERERREE